MEERLDSEKLIPKRDFKKCKKLAWCDIVSKVMGRVIIDEYKTV